MDADVRSLLWRHKLTFEHCDRVSFLEYQDGVDNDCEGTRDKGIQGGVG